jgi:hypothetical protein
MVSVLLVWSVRLPIVCPGLISENPVKVWLVPSRTVVTPFCVQVIVVVPVSDPATVCVPAPVGELNVAVVVSVMAPSQLRLYAVFEPKVEPADRPSVPVVFSVPVVKVTMPVVPPPFVNVPAHVIVVAAIAKVVPSLTRALLHDAKLFIKVVVPAASKVIVPDELV